MADTIISPTPLTPGIANFGYPGSYRQGPEWASFGPSDAHLVSANHAAVNAFGVSGLVNQNFDAHIIRDAVERRQDAAELRAEIKSIGSRVEAQNCAFTEFRMGVSAALAEQKAAQVAQENARLREEISNSRVTAMLEKVLDRLPTPTR